MKESYIRVQILFVENQMSVRQVIKEWKEKMEKETKKFNKILENERRDNAEQIRELHETTVTLDEMNKKVDEVTQVCEGRRGLTISVMSSLGVIGSLLKNLHSFAPKPNSN